jgi:hypothetical protein
MQRYEYRRMIEVVYQVYSTYSFYSKQSDLKRRWEQNELGSCELPRYIQCTFFVGLWTLDAATREEELSPPSFFSPLPDPSESCIFLFPWRLTITEDDLMSGND